MLDRHESSTSTLKCINKSSWAKRERTKNEQKRETETTSTMCDITLQRYNFVHGWGLQKEEHMKQNNLSDNCNYEKKKKMKNKYEREMKTSTTKPTLILSQQFCPLNS